MDTGEKGLAEAIGVSTRSPRSAESREENPQPVSGQAPPVCEETPYPRYEPGIYDAECTSACIYRDPRFRAWKCRLEFSILPGGERVFGFLHLGNGQKAHAGRSSEYWRAWVIASGDQPRRRQVLTPRVFVGKIFEVKVSDVLRGFDGRNHPTGAVYSVVPEIVRRIYP